MSNSQSSSLTVFVEVPADRFPNFERELGKRRFLSIRFEFHHFGMSPQPWDWMIGRCRNWSEVERILNWHNVDWQWERKRATTSACAAIALDGGRISRL